MYTHADHSAIVKLMTVIAVVLLVSAGVAYFFLRGNPSYTQILLDVSPSDSVSLSPVTECAADAIRTALTGPGSTLDIGLVSDSPAAMNWRTIDGTESFWTRLSIGRAAHLRELAQKAAFVDLNTLIHARVPPNSSDELSALAAAQARAKAVAPNIDPSHRTTILCGDGHWSGAGGSSYRGALDPAGIHNILDDLRTESLLPDWRGARLVMSANTADKWDLPATREMLIGRFWRAWASASHAKL